MKIDTLKDLENLIKLCRKTGVDAIEVDGIKMNLGPSPIIPKRKPRASIQQEAFNTTDGTMDVPDIETPDELTEEQMLMWSAVGNQQ